MSGEKLVFLIFLNRSGSTFLSKKLDEFHEIGVTPEALIPDSITYQKYSLTNRKNINSYLNKLYKDHKFLSWGIDKDKLMAQLEKSEFPLPFNKFLMTLLREYFVSNPASVYIYKSNYLFTISKIRRLFPDAKFLLIVRDIRAMYKSQKTTRDTSSKKWMAIDPIKPVIYYKAMIKLAQLLRNKKWFYMVKYEDLLKNTESELEGVLSFLEISNTKKTNQSNYFEGLSESQKKIHENLNSEPLLSKIDDWKLELKVSEKFILQRLGRKELIALGYTLEKLDLGLVDWLDILWITVKYLHTVKGKYTSFKTLLWPY